MQIRKFIVGPIGANCYVVWSEDSREGVMIDPGGASPQIEEYIKENHIHINKIVLTHGHFDHIGGLDEAKALTGAPVYIAKDDADCLTSSGKNISTMMGQAKTFEPADVLMKDGDVISIDDKHQLTVMLTPGHTPGGCCLIGKEVVFTGDTLFYTSIGRTDFPGGDYQAIIASVKKLMTLDEHLKVLPGHGENSEIGFERHNNPFI
ncbi:MAG: MBL fold metallo-hydrolase [Eubacteriaceae bacterium]|nr:MBL fold metallo-hydrolase [Eubacteriaceae bacterium]MDD4507823.1 MBL fold metallo-hydrolase [Eubacteriaceae bacterium]